MQLCHAAQGSETSYDCGCAGTKYTVEVHRRAPDAYSLTMGSSCVDTVTRILTDGSLLVQASHCHKLGLPCGAAWVSAMSANDAL